MSANVLESSKQEVITVQMVTRRVLLLLIPPSLSRYLS